MSWPLDTVGGQDGAPAVLYHGTSRKAWKKIKTKGLRPGRPEYHDLSIAARRQQEPDYGVYLARMPSSARQHARNHQPGVVLEVDVDGLDLVHVRWDGTYVAYSTIEPDRLTKVERT